MRPINKRTAAIAAVAALAAGGGGAAIAATAFDSPTERSAAIVSAAAKELGVEPDELSAALAKAEKAQIDADVAAGRLTKEQGEALKDEIDAGNVPLVGSGWGRGLGHHGRLGVAMQLDAAASYLGLPRDQLLTELRDGKTLAGVARERGKSVDGLVDALVAAAKKRLDARVADGTLTRDQADRIEADLEEVVTSFVDGTHPLRSGGRLRGGPAFLPGLGWHRA